MNKSKFYSIQNIVPVIQIMLIILSTDTRIRSLKCIYLSDELILKCLKYFVHQELCWLFFHKVNQSQQFIDVFTNSIRNN